MNFWQQLPKPFFTLAPLDDVTDVVFRQVVAAAAPPDVFFTEFTSIDGLLSPGGRESTMLRLRIEPGLEQPLVAQIWGNDPAKYETAAREVAAMGFSGIDINMGCPERSVVARTCGGGLIGNYELTADIIAATKRGAGKLPVSVKTRVGIHQQSTEDWASHLLRQGLAALTIHARTVREMSKVPARWEEIAKVVRLRDELAPDTVVIGNGDVRDRAHGLALARNTGADGIMIGRGIFHDLYAFETTPREHTRAELLAALENHLHIYEQWGSTRQYQALKKFYKIYVNGWPGAADMRAQLMDSQSPAEARAIIAQPREWATSEK